MTPLDLARLGLSGATLSAALVCLDAEQRSNGEPWPMSAGLLAQALDLPRSTAARAIADLVDRRLIEATSEPRGCRAGRYRLRMDALASK